MRKEIERGLTKEGTLVERKEGGIIHWTGIEVTVPEGCQGEKSNCPLKKINKYGRQVVLADRRGYTSTHLCNEMRKDDGFAKVEVKSPNSPFYIDFDCLGCESHGKIFLQGGKRFDLSALDQG